MSIATLETTAVQADEGSDLASLVVAYHRRAHAGIEPAACAEKACRVAHQVVDLDAMFFGADA